jgi:hypothetical protein
MSPHSSRELFGRHRLLLLTRLTRGRVGLMASRACGIPVQYAQPLSQTMQQDSTMGLTEKSENHQGRSQ